MYKVKGPCRYNNFILEYSIKKYNLIFIYLILSSMTYLRAIFWLYLILKIYWENKKNGMNNDFLIISFIIENIKKNQILLKLLKILYFNLF